MDFDCHPHCNLLNLKCLFRCYDKAIKERGNVFIIQNTDSKPGTWYFFPNFMSIPQVRQAYTPISAKNSQMVIVSFSQRTGENWSRNANWNCIPLPNWWLMSLSKTLLSFSLHLFFFKHVRCQRKGETKTEQDPMVHPPCPHPTFHLWETVTKE